MTINEENKIVINVVKRDGKKVNFDASKIAVTIKKGFDSVINENEEPKYNEKDIQKVFHAVLKRIEKEYKDQDKIKIEAIQDMIEEELQKKGYEDVFKSFSEYRIRRAQSREQFFDDKKRHKFSKTIESLGLKSAHEEDAKRENANVDGDTAMGTMLQFGSTVSKEFAKAYLMKKKFAEAHDNGDIHIHDMDFMAMGTTTCCQLDLKKLFKNGFSTGHGFLREPNDIMSYGALAAIAIQANQNDQHGGQAIPAFDFFLAPGVLKTYKKQFKQTLFDLLEYSDFITFVNFDKIVEQINKLTSIEFDVAIFDKYAKGSEEIKRIYSEVGQVMADLMKGNGCTITVTIDGKENTYTFTSEQVLANHASAMLLTVDAQLIFANHYEIRDENNKVIDSAPEQWEVYNKFNGTDPDIVSLDEIQAWINNGCDYEWEIDSVLINGQTFGQRIQGDLEGMAQNNYAMTHGSQALTK